MPKAITLGLRLLDIDVLTAQEDEAATLTDPALLDRATALHRILFTFDDDLLAEAALRQKKAIQFAGVIYAHQLGISIGACIRDLEIITKVAEPEYLANRVEFLPF